MQQQCHDPCRHGRHQNDKDGVSQTFQPGAHIQLGKVDAAGDERKARNDEEHGADIPGLVLRRYGKQHLCQLQQDGIHEACGTDRSRDAQKQGEVVLCQLAPYKVADACTAEGTQHLDGAAAQQKGEAAAGQRGCKAQRDGRIQAVDALDLIEVAVQRFAGHELALPVEVVDKMFQPVQPGGVHARICQAERLGIALVAIKTGELDGQQTNVRRCRNAQLPRESVHRASDTPCTRAAFQQHQPGAANDRCLFYKACLRDRNTFAGGRIVVPVDFHVIFDDLTLPLSHTGKASFVIWECCSPLRLRCYYKGNCRMGKTYLGYADDIRLVLQTRKDVAFLSVLR